MASNVQGLRDAVRDNETGLLYTYGDVGDLSSKIKSLLTDQNLRTRLTLRAVEWSRQFDWEIAARQTMELLTKRVNKAKL